ncbi:MAG: family 43 glycosylhydrolase [Anaerolineae bacterium]
MKLTFVTDARKEGMEVACPHPRQGNTADRTLLVRYLGHRVEFYVDGELVDEEWPMGNIPFGSSSRIIVGDVSAQDVDVTFYRGAGDIDTLPEAVAAQGSLGHEQAMGGGLEQRTIQYWKPVGHNTGVGDCMPFYHEGRFHLFYLFDRRSHKSKWGKGAHQWAHISTTDLIHWESHPMAIPITEEWEGSICTGSLIHHDGCFHAYYAVRTMDGSPAKLTQAVSRDGIRFDKTQAYWTLTDPYHAESARDPVVLQDADGTFHMLVTTSDMRLPIKQNGCLAHLVSKDLETWEQKEPFLTPGYSAQPECADWFAWNGWCYLIFSNGQFGPRYRMARKPLGPWIRPVCDRIDGYAYMVPKSAAFQDGRRILAGFVKQPGSMYAGRLVLRELVQNADGSLGTRFLPEALPAIEEAAQKPSEALSGHMETQQNAFVLGSAEGLAVARVPTPSRNYRVRVKARAEEGTANFGLCVRASVDLASGFEVRFCPEIKMVLIGSIDKGMNAVVHPTYLEHVEGLDGEVDIQLVVYQDIIDLCINGIRTLVCPISPTAQAEFSVFAHEGQVAFSDMTIEAIS